MASSTTDHPRANSSDQKVDAPPCSVAQPQPLPGVAASSPSPSELQRLEQLVCDFVSLVPPRDRLLAYLAAAEARSLDPVSMAHAAMRGYRAALQQTPAALTATNGWHVGVRTVALTLQDYLTALWARVPDAATAANKPSQQQQQHQPVLPSPPSPPRDHADERDHKDARDASSAPVAPPPSVALSMAGPPSAAPPPVVAVPSPNAVEPVGAAAAAAAAAAPAAVEAKAAVTAATGPDAQVKAAAKQAVLDGPANISVKSVLDQLKAQFGDAAVVPHKWVLRDWIHQCYDEKVLAAKK